MAVKQSKRAYDHAKNLISEGKCVKDEKDEWSKHQPSAEKENEFIKENGFSEYGKWYLGILKMQQHICMACLINWGKRR